MTIVLEPSSLEARRGFQFAIAMHRAGGVAETDILDNIMFHLAAAGLWQIAELHTLAKDTCMANLLTDKGQGRTGFRRLGRCGSPYIDAPYLLPRKMKTIHTRNHAQ
jgi:hypothetical protein